MSSQIGNLVNPCFETESLIDSPIRTFIINDDLIRRLPH
jgi:hypothetical protein